MATNSTSEGSLEGFDGLVEQLMVASRPSPDQSTTENYGPNLDEFPGFSRTLTPTTSRPHITGNRCTTQPRDEYPLESIERELPVTPPQDRHLSKNEEAETTEWPSPFNFKQAPPNYVYPTPSSTYREEHYQESADGFEPVGPPDFRPSKPVTPCSVKSESVYDITRDPRLVTPGIPVRHRSASASTSAFPSSPYNPHASRSMASDVFPSDSISERDQLSKHDEFDKLSIEDEESFVDSFDGREIQLPEAIRTAWGRGRKDKLPILLYRTWHKESGGYNSKVEFRPGIVVKESPPEPSEWDLKFLKYAANHFNRQREPTPFISFSRTFLVVLKKALEAMADGRDPLITIIDPIPAQDGFLYAHPICRAVRDRGLANPKTVRYGATSEWFFWGSLRAGDYENNPFLHTIRAADLLAMAEMDARILAILRIEILRTDCSVRKILKTLVKNPIVCDENVASALALIARTCGFNVSSSYDHLQHFISELANGCAIKPCPIESKTAVAAAFTGIFTQEDRICTLFSSGVKEGYTRLINWARSSTQRAEHAAQRAAEGNLVPHRKEIPFLDQTYQPPRGRRSWDEDTTQRITRAASSAFGDKGKSRARSRSISTYHPKRLVRSRSLGAERKRKREDSEENVRIQRRKLVAVEL